MGLPLVRGVTFNGFWCILGRNERRGREMGILDDLKMGLGFEEKTRDYYDRTAKTIERNDGSDAADKYREYIGFTPGGTHTGSYGSAPHYSDTSTGPQVSDFRQGPRPDNIPTPGTFSHSMGQMPGMIGLLPLTAMSTQMSAGPNMMPAPASPSTQFSPYDASGTFMEMSQPDSNMFGVDGGMPAMPATDVDAPFARRMAGRAIDAPADFFPTADGAVMAGSPEADEAAYQQWLSTEGSNKLIQQWDKTNPGFSRRMYDTAKRIKAGKF